jgi:hypothetical protein
MVQLQYLELAAASRRLYRVLLTDYLHELIKKLMSFGATAKWLRSVHVEGVIDKNGEFTHRRDENFFHKSKHCTVIDGLEHRFSRIKWLLEFPGFADEDPALYALLLEQSIVSEDGPVARRNQLQMEVMRSPACVAMHIFKPGAVHPVSETIKEAIKSQESEVVPDSAKALYDAWRESERNLSQEWGKARNEPRRIRPAKTKGNDSDPDVEAMIAKMARENEEAERKLKSGATKTNSRYIPVSRIAIAEAKAIFAAPEGEVRTWKALRIHISKVSESQGHPPLKSNAVLKKYLFDAGIKTAPWFARVGAPRKKIIGKSPRK